MSAVILDWRHCVISSVSPNQRDRSVRLCWCLEQSLLINHHLILCPSHFLFSFRLIFVRLSAQRWALMWFTRQITTLKGGRWCGRSVERVTMGLPYLMSSPCPDGKQQQQKRHRKKIFKFSNQIQFESLKFGLLCSLLLQVLHAK